MRLKVVIYRLLTLVCLIAGGALVAVGHPMCWLIKCNSRDCSIPITQWHLNPKFNFDPHSSKVKGQYFVLAVQIIYSLFILVLFTNFLSYNAECIIACFSIPCLIGCAIVELYYWIVIHCTPCSWRIAMVFFLCSGVLLGNLCMSSYHMNSADGEDNEANDEVETEISDSRERRTGSTRRNKQVQPYTAEANVNYSVAHSNWHINYSSAFEY